MLQDTYNEDRNAFVNRQEAVRKNAFAARQDTASQAAGGQLANGDFPGAQNTLYRAGDIKGGQEVQTYSDAQRQQHAVAAQRVTKGLRAAIQAGHTPSDAYDMAVQAAPALGIDPGDLQKMRPAFDKDPRGFLDVVDAQAQKELQHVQGPNGEIGAFDPVKGTYNVVRKGEAPKPLILSKGAQAYAMDDPNAPPAASPAQGAAPSADAVWASIKNQESGGQKQPGTAVGPATAYGHALGSTQMLPATAQAMAAKLGVVYQPALLQQNTPQALAYQDKLGRAYFDEGVQKSGGDLAGGAAYYYGGPDMKLHGPKTAAYVQQVMAKAGAGAPSTLRGGAGSDTLAPKGYHLIASNAEPDQSAAVDPNIVKGLIEGRIVPPTQKAAATPYWQAQLQAAVAQDPTFDGVNFQARQKARNDFTSGKSADNKKALNTVIGHLDSLDRKINGLGNTGGFPGSRWNNQIAQAIAVNSGTDQRYAGFNADKTAVANELTRVFRGTGGAEADIQGYLRQLDSASSPQTLHVAVRSIAELINSRVEALGAQYNQAMGTTKDPVTLLDPDKQRAFARLRGEAQAGAPAASQAAPKAGAVIRYDVHGNRVQ